MLVRVEEEIISSVSVEITDIVGDIVADVTVVDEVLLISVGVMVKVLGSSVVVVVSDIDVVVFNAVVVIVVVVVTVDVVLVTGQPNPRSISLGSVISPKTHFFLIVLHPHSSRQRRAQVTASQ